MTPGQKLMAAYQAQFTKRHSVPAQQFIRDYTTDEVTDVHNRLRSSLGTTWSPGIRKSESVQAAAHLDDLDTFQTSVQVVQDIESISSTRLKDLDQYLGQLGHSVASPTAIREQGVLPAVCDGAGADAPATRGACAPLVQEYQGVSGFAAASLTCPGRVETVLGRDLVEDENRAENAETVQAGQDDGHLDTFEVMDDADDVQDEECLDENPETGQAVQAALHLDVSPHAMPDRANLAYATFQMFRNRKSKTLAEWVLKIRVADAEDFALNPTAPALREYYVSFRPGGARKLRAKIKGWIDAKVLSEAFLERVNNTSRRMHADAQMGLVSCKAYAGPKPKIGQSSNARSAFDDQWAVLRLTEDKQSPRDITLWLDAEHPPIVISFAQADTTTDDGTRREERAAGWYAYYDPEHRMRQLHHDARQLAEFNRRQTSLKEWHPMSAISRIILDVAAPLHERIEQLEAEREADRGQLIKLETMLAELIQTMPKL